MFLIPETFKKYGAKEQWRLKGDRLEVLSVKSPLRKIEKK
jgi:hypothetical protein